MAYSDTSISIHLVKDRNNEKLDDIIRIIKNLEDNVFEVTYKDNGDPLMHKVRYMTRDNASDYLYFLLKNLSLDEDGYQHIQFSLPAMPRVLIAASRLTDSSYREHFLELIECGLGLLDKVEKLSIKKPVENTNRFTYNHYNTLGSNEKDRCVYSSCGNKCNSTLPNLPASPDHRYFE
jgi:hypothetical protein